MTVPDPAHPKVGDQFTMFGGDTATILNVGERTVHVRDTTGEEGSCSLDWVAQKWTPVRLPLITEDVTLFQKRPTPDSHTWWSPTGGSGTTGRAIILHPGGTYTEVTA